MFDAPITAVPVPTTTPMTYDELVAILKGRLVACFDTFLEKELPPSGQYDAVTMEGLHSLSQVPNEVWANLKSYHPVVTTHEFWVTAEQKEHGQLDKLATFFAHHMAAPLMQAHFEGAPVKLRIQREHNSMATLVMTWMLPVADKES